jgi:hypothetical protein
MAVATAVAMAGDGESALIAPHSVWAEVTRLRITSAQGLPCGRGKA